MSCVKIDVQYQIIHIKPSPKKKTEGQNKVVHAVVLKTDQILLLNFKHIYIMKRFIRWKTKQGFQILDTPMGHEKVVFNYTRKPLNSCRRRIRFRA